MKTITASDARLPVDAFNEVAYKHERLEIRRLRGKASVFVISQEDMDLFEELEDRYWGNEAVAALQRHEASGKMAESFDEVKKGLGL